VFPCTQSFSAECASVELQVGQQRRDILTEGVRSPWNERFFMGGRIINSPPGDYLPV